MNANQKAQKEEAMKMAEHHHQYAAVDGIRKAVGQIEDAVGTGGRKVKSTFAQDAVDAALGRK